MGRSVSTPGEALDLGTVFYLAPWSDDDPEYDEDGDPIERDWEFEWEWFMEDLETVVQDTYPSVSTANWWADREDRVFAQNQFASFGVSEYSGLVAVWAILNPSVPDSEEGLAKAWLRRSWSKLEKSYPWRLGMQGRFSNGEAVFGYADPAAKEAAETPPFPTI